MVRALFMLALLNLAATLFMTGLVWFVQAVHYPLYIRVPGEGFIDYQKAHTRLTTFVVGPPMLIELGTSILLVIHRPVPVDAPPLWIGLGLTLLIWVSTMALQIPLHDVLTTGYDAAAQRRLVRTNWLRTAAWSLRSVLMVWVVFRMVDAKS
jgi:hypothetical protein